MKPTIYLSVLFFCLLNCPVYGQQEYQNYLTKSELQEDLEVLQVHLRKLHAGLYEYTDKAQIDSAFAQIQNDLKDSLTDLDFYRLLAPMQKVIKNGHTMVIPSEQWSNYKIEERPLFPFEIYFDQDKLYIRKNLSDDDSFETGTKILSINELPVREVIDKLASNITRDGENRTYPMHLMSLGFEHWYADIIGTPTQFKLKIQLPGSDEPYERIIPALKEEEMNAYHLKRYGQTRVAWFLRPNTKQLDLTIDGNTAILCVPSFDSNEKSAEGENYTRFCKRAFAQIKAAKIKHLILDIRDNGGGDPMPQLALLSHLLDEPMQVHKKTYAITNEIPNPEYYPNDNIKKFNRLAKLVLKKEDSIYVVRNNIFSRMQGSPPKAPIQPKKDLYTGKLYVLIDGGSFSATGECAGILKDRQRGVFIGEETGGSDWQNTSGRMLMLHLPNSGVRIRMPLLVFELNVESSNDGYGVIPDHTVRNTINDVLKGEDAVMEYTKSLIARYPGAN